MNAPGKSTVIDQYPEFKGDHTNTDDAERSDGTTEAVNQENIKMSQKQFSPFVK